MCRTAASVTGPPLIFVLAEELEHPHHVTVPRLGRDGERTALADVDPPMREQHPHHVGVPLCGRNGQGAVPARPLIDGDLGMGEELFHHAVVAPPRGQVQRGAVAAEGMQYRRVVRSVSCHTVWWTQLGHLFGNHLA